MDHEFDITGDTAEEVNEKLRALAFKAMALSMLALKEAIEDEGEYKFDPRSFVAGVVSSQVANQVPPTAPVGEMVGQILGDLFPEVDRVTMEDAAKSGDPFKDLPTTDEP